MKNDLKIEPRPLKQTVVDMVYSMIEEGFLKKTHRYKGKPMSTNNGDNIVPYNKGRTSSDLTSCNPEEKGLCVDTAASRLPDNN